MANSLSHKDILEKELRENEDDGIEAGRTEFRSEDERSRYLIGVFPGLVKEGKFVEAMELVHGNGSFNWFYGLFDRFSRWLVKKTLQKGAGKEQTVQEHLMDQAA